MPTVNKVERKRTASGNVQDVLSETRISVNSRRNSRGELVLTSNPHDRWKSKLVSDTFNGKDYRSHPWGSGVLLPSCFALDYARLEARSYSSLRRKLYEGSASLGVTLAGYKQSREMIVKRYNQLKLYTLATLGRTAIREAIRDGKKLRPKDAASLHLEVIFGWVPLLEDIHKAATTVIQAADTYAWLKSRASSNQHFSDFAPPYNNWANVTIDASFNVSHSRGVEVVVSNPNVWLAERAGLLNPVSVAWDLVPWSFVVNMFVNTGQLVNTVTDFAGLEMRNGWATKKARGIASWSVPVDKNYPRDNPGRTLYYTCDEKHTVLNAVSRPPLVFKLPDASWDLAAMASSLFVQKFSKLAGLINPNRRGGSR